VRKLALSILCISALIAVLSIAAFATVQPPKEWLDQSAANRQRWDEMRPQLQQWEAGNPPETRLPEGQALEGIITRFGELRGEHAVSASSDDSGYGKFDLNNDGMIDQYDVLELGYQPTVRKHVALAGSKGVNKVFVVRVEFSDQAADTDAWDYDYMNDLLLADGTGANPSFRDYYQEVSYGDLDIQGTIDNQGNHDGWYTAPNTRDYYKNNIMELLLFAAQSVDDHTDFSDFDVDGDGYVDSFMLFYPYTEFSGGLWPHMSSGMNYYADGVIVDIHYVSGLGGSFSDSYNMCCAGHEYGHVMGAVDLYDYGYDSDGVGRWSMMAYNYDTTFRPPAFDPWHRMQFGWLTPIVITEDTTALSIPQVETNRFALKLWKNGNPGDEYFLVENLQKVGTDATRPGAGLMIFHCDDTKTNNNDQTHKLVDVECADGLDANGKDHLDYYQESGGNNGDANDPFYSGNNIAFNFTSNPPSKSYAGADSYVKVENISASGATMTADISVETGTNPSVTITAPTGGSTVSGNVTFSADATASGARTISKVDFYANGCFVGTDTTASGNSFSVTWNSTTCFNTEVPISAKATDSAGETTTASINVTPDNPGIWPFTDDCESLTNFATFNPSGNAFWELKTDFYNSASHSIGIGGGTGGYDYNEHDRLYTPLLDLNGATAPTIGFYIRYRVSNAMDNVRVYVVSEDGTTETQLKAYTGTDLSWKSHAVYLDDWAGEKVFIAFELNSTSLSHDTNGGAWVDDVDLHERSAAPTIDSITPADGSDVSGEVNIQVDASDDIAVTYVAWWMNGDYYGADTTEPFEISWNSREVFNGSVQVTVKAFDRDEQFDTADVTYNVTNSYKSTPYLEAFEDSGVFADDWIVRDSSGPGTWQLSGYRYYQGAQSVYCGIAADHQYGAYEYDWLISPTIELTGVSALILFSNHWYSTEAGYDFARVYATTDLDTWDLLGSWDGSSGGWQRMMVSLSAYSVPVKLAFLLQSDPLSTGEGWYVDGVIVRPAPVVDSVSPNRAYIGQTVTISGHDFGGSYFPGVLELSGHGVVTGGEVTSWSDTEIVLSVPAGTTSGDIVLYGCDTGKALTIVLPAPTLGSLGQY
jgi:M6 family metalloprotease-like protein